MVGRNMHKHGFTLVELLVVLAILAILMAIMVPGAGRIMRKMKEAQARGDAIAVASIVSTYYSEYNRWPDWPGIDKTGANATDADWVLVMTMGHVPVNASISMRKYNPRLIQFWEPNAKVLDANGAWVDPWGNPFQYLVDYNNDGEIKAPDGTTVRAKVVAWSWGVNGVDDQCKEDDILSW